MSARCATLRAPWQPTRPSGDCSWPACIRQWSSACLPASSSTSTGSTHASCATSLSVPPSWWPSSVFSDRRPTRTSPSCRWRERFAVDWTIESWPAAATGAVHALPRFMRRRVAMRLARRVLQQLGAVGRLVVRRRAGALEAELVDSVFCDVRAVTAGPLCAFHAAVTARFFERFDLPTLVRFGDAG